MGKTKGDAKRIQPKKAKVRKKAALKKPKLTPDQELRLAAFDALMKQRDEDWAAMSPAQRAEENAKWEKVKATINGERAGYRLVFVDD